MGKSSVLLRRTNQTWGKIAKKQRLQWMFSFNGVAAECLTSLVFTPSKKEDIPYELHTTINGERYILHCTKELHPERSFSRHAFFIPLTPNYYVWHAVFQDEKRILQEILGLSDEQYFNFWDTFHDIVRSNFPYLDTLFHVEKQKEKTRHFLEKKRKKPFA